MNKSGCCLKRWSDQIWLYLHYSVCLFVCLSVHSFRFSKRSRLWLESPAFPHCKGRTRTFSLFFFLHLSYKTPLNCHDFPSLNILYADLFPWQLKGNKNNKAKYSPWMSLVIGHMDLFRWKISLLEADVRGYGLSLVTVMPWHPLVPGNATLHYVSEATLEFEPYVPQCLRGGRFLIILFGFHSSCPGLWEVYCLFGWCVICIKQY